MYSINVVDGFLFFFFQAEDGIRDFCLSRGLGDVYKRQVQLPSDYYEFHVRYSAQKCAICKQFPFNGSLFLCLKCGEIICNTECLDSTPFVNILKHSKNEHRLECFYIDTKTTELIVIAKRKGPFSYGYLYKNQLGEQFDGDLAGDWREFKLDTILLEKVQDLFRFHDTETIAIQDRRYQLKSRPFVKSFYE
eukprot:TRINITY_DN11049_c0_g1_i1.p1 TRINITY_DN11049_c0_g1~~TRINITY_DN11049_c0_g1_i1.p1  ORF type:complete len:192 (-),score=32.64 TRINITY_DN11049_c0_g1_i1:78-653(-)